MQTGELPGLRGGDGILIGPGSGKGFGFGFIIAGGRMR